MQTLFLLALLLCCAIATGCTPKAPTHEIVMSNTPIAKEVVGTIEAGDFDTAEFTASDGTVLQYRLLVPTHYVEGKRYPLVLQLHGSGGIGTDNLKQIDRLAKTWAMPDIRQRYQAYILVPQFSIRSANYGPPAADQHSEHSPALIAAVELVDAFALNHAVDSARVYAVGFSMGGSAAWLAPTLRPTLFAAALPISGIAPENTFAPIFMNLPTLVIHGNSDTENPMTADFRFVREVGRLGGTKIQLREYQGLDHQLPQDIYPGYWWRDWLFAQHRN